MPHGLVQESLDSALNLPQLMERQTPPFHKLLGK
jgi:hypothetical protein